MADNNSKKAPLKPKSGLGLVAAVALLITTNIWLANYILSASSKQGELPRPKTSFISAVSWVIKNDNRPTTAATTKNILVLGKSGGGYIAPDLTDTILVIHINGPSPKTKVISLPRDLAVKTKSGALTKINALYQQGLATSEKAGLELIKSKVEEITGLAINSFVLFDLGTVAKVIDDIGGLNIKVVNDINDTRFPNDRGGYETFTLKKGVRYLNGQTTLKFVRTRHSPRGDFERIERQQEVLKALKGKLISLNPIWDFPKTWNIFRTIQKDVRTDLSFSDFRELWRLAKDSDLDKIKTFNLDPESGLVEASQTKLGGITAYVVVAKEKPFDYNEIRKSVKTFLEN